MAINPAALAAEIHTDPAGLGFAALVAAGNDAGIAASLNARTGPGAASVSQGVVPKDVLARSLTAPMANLLARPASDAMAIKYAGWLQLLRIVETVDTAEPVFLGTLAAMVADGLLSQADFTAATTRPGSRAEALFGAGILVGVNDVSFALRGM